MKTFVGIIGTTCTGKSATAVELAKLLRTEVISADSMQIYKGMDVGTAKITQREMQGVPHHMLDIALPCEDYSAFLYREKASEIIDKMTTTPIVVGGTGFYFDSLVYPPEFGTSSKQRREELLEIYRTKGVDELVKILKELDPSALDVVDTFNYKRVIRAIEIAENGQSISKGTARRSPQYDIRLFVLELPRDELYRRIDERVDKMVDDGLVNEVENLLKTYGKCDATAFSAIGYKEIISYLQGETSFNAAIEQIKLNTRHYSKRQISYIKRMNVQKYIDVFDKTPKETAQEIYTEINI